MNATASRTPRTTSTIGRAQAHVPRGSGGRRGGPKLDAENIRPANLKFTEVDYACLEGVSWVRRVTVTDTVRRAIRDYLVRRSESPTIGDEIDAAKRRDAERRESLLRAIIVDDAAELVMPPVRQTTRKAVDVRPITVRLSANFFNKLTAFALIDDNTVARQIRQAVDEHLDSVLLVTRTEFADAFADPGRATRLGEQLRAEP